MRCDIWVGPRAALAPVHSHTYPATTRRLFVNLVELETKPIAELHDLAKGLGLELPGNVRKSDLAFRVLKAEAERHGNHFAQGVLDIVEDGSSERHNT